jgi:hypothetical protein
MICHNLFYSTTFIFECANLQVFVFKPKFGENIFLCPPAYFYLHMRVILLLIFILTPGYSNPASWGFFAHKNINRHAVFTLPSEMMVLYKKHIHQLTESSVDPDRRRYIVENEAPRHYIDLDRYPIADSIPPGWKEAVLRFTEDSLLAHGIVPWHIERQRRALTNAFRQLDGSAILKLSADLGHYIGDAHVPLHTTSNYDGQQSGQEGIHGLWESRLPELFFENFDLFTGGARYLDSPLEDIWKGVYETHALVDSVLSIEKQLQLDFGEDKMKGFEYRGKGVMQVYSREYALAYHRLLGDMVERQFRKSVAMTGNLWYTCWINAGQPDLSDCYFRSGFSERWREKYDSLYRYDSTSFQTDSHLGNMEG